MKQVLPKGITQEQWAAITHGLQDHPSTLNDYRKIMNLFYSWNQSSNLTETTKENAEDYFAYLEERANSGEMSANTVHRYQATLRAVGSRMEANQEVFPGFVNPFAGILHNEVRKKTTFSADDFVSPDIIRKIMKVIPTFPEDKQIVLEMMLYIGLRPYHIENLRYSNFKKNPNNPNELLMSFVDGSYVKKFNRYEKPQKSMVLSSTSRNGNETYQVLATWKFFDAYSKKLLSLYPELGISNSDTPLFVTKRKQSYGYRPIHNLVQEACTRASLKPTAATPYQLSLYGSVHSKLVYDSTLEQRRLKTTISRATSRVETNRASSKLREVNDEFLRLVENGWIGGWVQDYPRNREIRLQEMTKQLGPNILHQILGI